MLRTVAGTRCSMNISDYLLFKVPWVPEEDVVSFVLGLGGYRSVSVEKILQVGPCRMHRSLLDKICVCVCVLD